MGLHSQYCQSLFLLCLVLSGAVNLCSANEKTFEVVGSAECADCKENNLKTNQAFSGIGVTIDCKLENGDMKRIGSSHLDDQGNFKVALSQDLDRECYAQLHSSSSVPCPTHQGLEASAIMFKSSSKDGTHNTFTPTKNIRFSSALCSSKFFWKYLKFPPLPPLKQWGHHPLILPPLPPLHKSPPVVYEPPVVNPLPPPAPIYEPKPNPPSPVYKPKPKTPSPVYKPAPKPEPKPKTPSPVYKPTPKPDPKPKTPSPVYKPKPKPPSPVYKPKPKPKQPTPVHKPAPKPEPPVNKAPKKSCPPITKSPVYKPPVSKPLPPPVPVYHPPVIKKPLPPIPQYPVPQYPIPPITKKPCPPLPKFPPKYYQHPKFGHFPPLPPSIPHA